MDNKSVKPGIVIVLNGPSAVGKTSIMNAFQKKQDIPWVGASIDLLYVGVLLPLWLDDVPEHSSVMTVKNMNKKGFNIVIAVFGAEGRKVISGMHGAIVAYTKVGNNVIVDYIKYEEDWIDEFKENLEGLSFLLGLQLLLIR